MINPQALETFGNYDKKSLMAGIVIGQGLKGRARAPRTPAPAGFPQELWDAAEQRANAMIASMQVEQQSPETPEPETPDDWEFDKDAFCFGIAAGRSLEGWEIDGIMSEVPDIQNLPDGWALIMYYVHVDGSDTVHVNFGFEFVNETVNIDWGDGSSLETYDVNNYNIRNSHRTHDFQSGDYIITCISNGGEYPTYSNSYSVSTGVYGTSNRVLLLHSVYLAGNVYKIDRVVFRNCSALESVTMPDCVTSIGNDAFYGCSALESVTMPENAIFIGESAFYRCTSLTSITIPSGSTIGSRAFAECTSLASVTICDGDSVTQIKSEAFFGCTSLLHITIPGNVKTIEYGTFARCTSLTDVTMCDGVTRINGYSKSGNELDEENGYYRIESSNGFREYKERGAFAFCSALTSVTMPESVVYIGGCTFLECTALTSITIPSVITEIAYGTFYKCTALTSITIPSGVSSIISVAFKYCTALKNVIIPNSVTHLWNHAFYGCSSLTNVTIPDGVWMGYRVFESCTSLVSVTIGANVIFNSATNTSLEYGLGSQFNDCSSLTSVTFRGNLTGIAANMFYKCTALTSITIPNGVTTISAYAFMKCTSLTSVTIPESVTYIGLEAFRLTKLTSVTISRNCYVFNRTYGVFPSNCVINYYD